MVNVALLDGYSNDDSNGNRDGDGEENGNGNGNSNSSGRWSTWAESWWVLGFGHMWGRVASISPQGRMVWHLSYVTPGVSVGGGCEPPGRLPRAPYAGGVDPASPTDGALIMDGPWYRKDVASPTGGTSVSKGSLYRGRGFEWLRRQGAIVAPHSRLETEEPGFLGDAHPVAHVREVAVVDDPRLGGILPRGALTFGRCLCRLFTWHCCIFPLCCFSAPHRPCNPPLGEPVCRGCRIGCQPGCDGCADGRHMVRVTTSLPRRPPRPYQAEISWKKRKTTHDIEFAVHAWSSKLPLRAVPPPTLVPCEFGPLQ